MNPQEVIKRLMEAGILTRSLAANPASFDDKTRSMEGIFATEAPVRIYDWDRGDIVSEVLLMSGAEFPSQIPFLDSHNRGSVQDQIGSGREMKISGEKLIGRVYFADTQSGAGALQLAKERHITDLSVGYVVRESIWIEDGTTYTHPDGRTFNGPLKLATHWSIKEISLVPIGADEGAKLRSDIFSPLMAERDKFKSLYEESEQKNRHLILELNRIHRK